MSDIDPPHRVDLTGFEPEPHTVPGVSSGSDVNAGHAPGSAGPFAAHTPAPPAPTLPGAPMAAPTAPITPGTGTPAPTGPHPALGPQFKIHGAHAAVHTAGKVVDTQAQAAAPPPSLVRPTTGWQHS